jgi:hypothetical protein
MKARQVWRASLCAALLLAGLPGTAQQASTGKKGVGLAERQTPDAARRLQALEVSWYYNWHHRSDLHTNAQFVPMVFGARSPIPAQAPVLLGFNEPDHPRQANLSVAQALTLWPQLEGAHALGAPVVAGHPLQGTWLPAFMQARPRVEFMTLHWYKGTDAQRLMRDVQALCERYGLPVWITEFAPSTAGQARQNPLRHSQQAVNTFIETVLPWLEKNPCVARYAWHDAKTGTSALWDAQGALTETGRRYAAVH